jgi:hypothetical protein
MIKYLRSNDLKILSYYDELKREMVFVLRTTLIGTLGLSLFPTAGKAISISPSLTTHFSYL